MTVVDGNRSDHDLLAGQRATTSTYRRTSDKLRIVSPDISIRQRMAEMWRYRELLGTLTRKEFKVQYKDSALGFLWSLFNPAITLLTYYFVFQIILKNGTPDFAIYLMSGLLVWNFFQLGTLSGCTSVVTNSPIVKKVAFPREIPALASVGAALIQMGLQAAIMVVFLVVFWHRPAFSYLPLLLPAVVALILLTSSLAVLFAAINVRFRDMNHLLGVALLVWTWACPIVYTYQLVRNKVYIPGPHGTTIASHHGYLLPLFYAWRANPVTPIVLAFQRSLYGMTDPKGAGGVVVQVLPQNADFMWYLWQLLAVIAFSLIMWVVALKVFGRLEGNFAEDL